MILGRVAGTVFASKKDPRLEGFKLLIVRPVAPDGNEEAGYVVAVDTVQAGVGDVVLVCSGSSARQTAQTKNKPVDAVIMAVVDKLDVGD